MGIFDQQAVDSVAASEEAFGSVATLNYATGGTLEVTVMKITAKPKLIPAPGADQEYREMEVRISAARYPVPKTLFAGYECDWFTDLCEVDGQDVEWWIVDLVAENDASTHRLVLRNKQIPKEYEFGG